MESGEVVDRLLFRLQKENLPLHATLSHAREMTHKEDTLSIVFEQSAAFHYRMVEPEMQEYLTKLCAEVTEREARVEVALLNDRAGQDRPEPVDEPAVQEFLKAFPGKYIVEAENGK